ncbi:MAG TPA: hypothetical protein VFY75_03720 [Solirubrobacterales bacterium]|nr:hypothetical protein [Solirubrobacterales bacterium]
MLAAARLQLLACAVIGALLVVGCGGDEEGTTQELTISSRPDGAAKDKDAPAPQGDGRPRRAPAGSLCQSQLGSFVGSMDGLRRRLAVGVTYDQYVAEVRGIRSTYGEIPTRKLQIDCLTLVATPSEKAFNRYIEGANDWGECVSELGCGTATIEPVLQRRWRIASHFLSEAKDGLDAIAG